MIIDLNLLKRLGKRFGVFPISVGPTPLQAALKKPEIVFIKAPAGLEPAITGGGYQWDDGLNGYRFGSNQKMFLAPDGTVIWIFKDVLFRGLSLDSVQKWTSGDSEYPMGKANAFFIVYGKLTGQDLGEGETAGENVPDGETEPGDGGGLATADDENAPPFSKQDIQQMLKGEFPSDTPAGPKASMDTAIPSEEPSAPMSGPPPSRLAKGGPPVETGSEAEKIIATLYKQAKINPKSKLSKQNPIRVEGDVIIDLYKRAKTMPPEEREKLMTFLKSGAILPLMEGHIAKYQLEALMEHIVGGIVDEVEKAKKKAKAKKAKKSYPSPDKEMPGDARFAAYQASQEKPHSQMDWDKGADNAPSYGSTGPSEEGAYRDWLEDLANKMWRDPQEIGKGQYLWRVQKVHKASTGELVFLLTKRKTIEQSRIFAKRGNKWYYLDPEMGNHHWKEVNEVPPGEEPSIEQEQSGAAGAGGMTTTSAVSPVTGPNAFAKKKKWTEKFQGRKEKEDGQLDEMTTTSGGGGSSAGTPGYQIPGAFGRKMSHRKDHIEVLGYKMTPQGEKEYNTPADKLYEAIKTNIKKMIREGIVQKPEGGKCPHCGKDVWSPDAMTCSSCKKRLPEKPVHKPGGKGVGVVPLQQEGTRTKTCAYCNMMAVNGVWTHEQGCPASKKRVKEASGLGADFDRAQRQYDNQMPPEDDPEVQCPDCGGAGHFTQQWKKGRYYQWSAKCDQCGNTWGDDNLDDDRGER